MEERWYRVRNRQNVMWEVKMETEGAQIGQIDGEQRRARMRQMGTRLGDRWVIVIGQQKIEMRSGKQRGVKGRNGSLIRMIREHG